MLFHKLLPHRASSGGVSRFPHSVRLYFRTCHTVSNNAPTRMACWVIKPTVYEGKLRLPSSLMELWPAPLWKSFTADRVYYFLPGSRADGLMLFFSFFAIPSPSQLQSSILVPQLSCCSPVSVELIVQKRSGKELQH